MATDMSQILGKVLNARNNYGAPESFKDKIRVKGEDMEGKVITIDEVIIMTKAKKDKNTGEYIKSKDGTKIIHQPYAYVAFDGDKYFSTKSALMIEQFQAISDIEIPRYEKAEIPVKGVKGITAKVGSEKVKYADDKMYPQPVLIGTE